MSHYRTEPWDFVKHGVSPSFVSQFLRCKYTTYLKYVEGWKSNRTSEPLQFGSAVHYVFERAYKHKTVPSNKKIAKWLAKYEKAHSDVFSNERYQVALGTANVVLQEYFRYYANDFSQMQDGSLVWEATEHRFELPVNLGARDGRTVKLNGIVDGIYRHTDGRWILDTKCKGRVNPGEIFDGFPMSFQFNAYMYYLYKRYNEVPTGVVCNVVRIPQIKQGKQSTRAYMQRVKEDVAKRPDFYFMRPSYRITKDELKYWVKRQLRPILIDIADWVNNDYQPRYANETGLMVGYRQSDYFDAVCQGDFTTLVKKGK